MLTETIHQLSKWIFKKWCSFHWLIVAALLRCNTLTLLFFVMSVSGLQPCYLKDWEMHVQFKVHGSGKKNLHGDGIAIWYTKDRLHPGNVGCSILMVLSTLMEENAPGLTSLHAAVVKVLKFLSFCFSFPVLSIKKDFFKKYCPLTIANITLCNNECATVYSICINCCISHREIWIQRCVIVSVMLTFPSLKCLENCNRLSFNEHSICSLHQKSFLSSCPLCLCSSCQLLVLSAGHSEVCSCLLMSHLISTSILGPVFGNQDQYLGLAIFLDTFRNDLHGMDVSL